MFSDPPLLGGVGAMEGVWRYRNGELLCRNPGADPTRDRVFDVLKALADDYRYCVSQRTEFSTRGSFNIQCCRLIHLSVVFCSMSSMSSATVSDLGSSLGFRDSVSVFARASNVVLHQHVGILRRAVATGKAWYVLIPNVQLNI